MSQNTYFVSCILRTYVLYVSTYYVRTNVQQNIAAFVRFLFYVELCQPMPTHIKVDSVLKSLLGLLRYGLLFSGITIF